MVYLQELELTPLEPSHEIPASQCDQRSHGNSRLNAGFAVVLRHIQVGFTYVYQTRTFTEQSKRDSYGSVFLKAIF